MKIKSLKTLQILLLLLIHYMGLGQIGTFAREKGIQTEIMQNIEEFHLKNGLKVIIKPDHTAPVFAQALFYKVGSRHDLEGKTGAAHFLEHMQFNGTELRQKGDIPKEIEAKGGTFNAGTSYDYTVYYMTLPASRENLEFAMELESDRMRNSIINDVEAERERNVVLAELSRGENNPISILYRETLKNLYPNHPYGDPIIGWREDVENTAAADLKAQYDKYYQPNNAVLVLVGDIDPVHARETLEQTFAKVPESKTGISRLAERAPRSYTERETVLDLPSESQSVLFTWDMAPFSHQDYVSLSVLSAVLSHGSLSRLEKALVDTGIASGVDASARQGIDSFVFSVLAITAQSGDLSQIENIIKSEIAKIQKSGISVAELERVKAKAQTYYLFDIEEPMDLAMQIGFFELVHGDWRDAFRWVERIDNVTVADVQNVAKKYLTEEGLYLGRLTPNVEENRKSISTVKEGDIDKGIHAETFQLSNGVQIILHENNSLPVIAISGSMDAGQIRETGSELPYGVSTLVANMLDRGTENYSRDQIAEILESIGSSIDISQDKEFIGIDAQGRSKDLETIMKLIAEELRYPAFPEDEFEKLKTKRLLQYQQSADDLNYLSRIASSQLLYPEGHAFYIPDIQHQVEALNELTISDLQVYYSEYYRPENLILSFSGDIKAEELKTLLEKYLSNWQAEDSPAQKTSVNTITPHAPVDAVIIEKPGKSQAVVTLTHNITVSRADPDYYALTIANDILGGGSSLTSRLGTSVREEAGLVYSIYSSPGTGREPAAFNIKLGTAPEKVDQAIEITNQTIKEFLNGHISDEELSRAKNYRKGSFISHNLTSNSNIARALAYYRLLGIEIETINEYVSKIEQITKEDVQRVSKEYLKPEMLQVIIAKPAIQ